MNLDCKSYAITDTSPSCFGALIYIALTLVNVATSRDGSSRTGLNYEDSSQTKNCGLGLEDHWPLFISNKM